MFSPHPYRGGQDAVLQAEGEGRGYTIQSPQGGLAKAIRVMDAIKTPSPPSIKNFLTTRTEQGAAHTTDRVRWALGVPSPRPLQSLSNLLVNMLPGTEC